MHDEEELSVDEERRLRGALATIGSASAEQARATEKAGLPIGESPTRHRPRLPRGPVMGAAAAVALVACLGTGIVLNRSDQPTTAGFPSASSGQDEHLRSQTLPEWISCSRVIAVGDVTKVTGANAARVKVTMHVTEWIRPAGGSSTLTFTDRNPKIDGGWPAWRTGGPVLVVIPANTSYAVNTFRGKDLTVNRNRIQGALTAGSKTVCRSPWAASAG